MSVNVKWFHDNFCLDAIRSKAKTPAKTSKKDQNTTKPKPSQTSKEENQIEVKKKKKARTTFTGRQIWELENTFKEKKYLTSAERIELADLLNVTDCQVKIWFQNRRTKYKKLEVNLTNGENENGEERITASSPGSPITSEGSAADHEISPGKTSPDNFRKGQKFSVEREKTSEDICMEVDDRGAWVAITIKYITKWSLEFFL